MKTLALTNESRERQRAYLELDTLMFKHGVSVESVNERCLLRYHCSLDDADAAQYRALANEIEDRAVVQARGRRVFTTTANAITNSWEGDAEK
jgi:hypothetical protein